MPQPMPVTRQVDWIQVIPQILAISALALPLSLLVVVFPRLSPGVPIVLAPILYIIFCRTMRAIFVSDYKQAIAAYRAERFTDAIEHLESSYKLFARHPRVDAWRSLLFGVACPNTFKAMSLCSLGYCHAQLGETAKAIAFFEKALAESPEYTMARAALNMLRSASQASTAAHDT